MKKLGYLILIVGFLAGALFAVLDELEVRWGLFSAALVLGAVGIAVLRLGEKHEIRSEGKLALNMQDIEKSLQSIVENITRLNAEKTSINPYDFRHRIDESFPEAITTFADARQSIAEIYGLQAYADVMSYFAAGERYLNRIWSASADGYIDEVNDYLDKAQIQFTEALDKIRKLKEKVI